MKTTTKNNVFQAIDTHAQKHCVKNARSFLFHPFAKGEESLTYL